MPGLDIMTLLILWKREKWSTWKWTSETSLYLN